MQKVAVLLHDEEKFFLEGANPVYYRDLKDLREYNP
jgi:hypothetical protein